MRANIIVVKKWLLLLLSLFFKRLTLSYTIFCLILQQTEPIDFSFNPEHEPEFKWFDHTLLEAVKSDEEHAHSFFRLLALCHTVMPEIKDGRYVSSYFLFKIQCLD